MDSPAPTDAELKTRIQQQETIAELGQQALKTDDLDQVIRDATEAVCNTLDTEYCHVLELLSDGAAFLQRHGVGWQEGDVRNAAVPADRDSQAGYTLLSKEPVIVDDLRTEERFSSTDLLVDHDVTSGITVIVGSIEDPWGVLGAFTTERRTFTDHDANFVQSIANIIASAIENEQTQTELEEIYGRISDAFFALDDEWNFAHLNERAHELINPEGGDLVGKHVWDAFPAANDRKFREKYEHAMAEQETVSFEEYYPEPLDAWFEVRAYPSETGLSVYFQDITERKEHERDLEESEQRYRTLAEYFPNGIVTIFDDELRYTLAAGQAFDDLLASADDIEGQTVREAWTDDVADTLEPAFQTVLDGNEQTVELEYAGREWRIHVVPLTDESGNVFGGMTMAQDITEQKERERFLQDAKSQLEAATEAGAVGTWEWNVQDDEMVVGPSFAQTFGVDPDAAREGVSLERFASAIHEGDRERVERKIDDALASCGEYEAEYRVWNADDELRWVVARGRVEYDDDGAPVTFPGALTDITERKQAEEALQKTKNQLETLFQVLPVGVIVADEDGQLIEVNKTATEIWGGDVFDAETIAEYERYPAWWADTGERVEPEEWTLARVLEGEEITNPDVFEIETTDGERRTIMVHGMPVRDAHGEATRGVATLTDITERKEYQRKLEETVSQLEVSNERLEQFAYAASHDLQEPLRMVSSYLRLLENRYADTLDEDAEEFINFAVDGADRMRAMIDSLLEYSRVTARGEPLEPADAEAILDDALDDLQLQIEEAGATITSNDLPTVTADSDQLARVFRNLISNALTYSGDEPPRVHVGAEQAADTWQFSVADEGVGIDPEYHDRIFNVFEQVHSAEEASESGAGGIGLALCERIIERHDGEIWVESEPGEGATFYFTIPIAEDHQPEPAASSPPRE